MSNPTGGAYRETRERRLAAYEDVAFCLGTAKHYGLVALERLNCGDQAAAVQWGTRAVFQIEQAQAYLAKRTEYQYAREDAVIVEARVHWTDDMGNSGIGQRWWPIHVAEGIKVAYESEAPGGRHVWLERRTRKAGEHGQAA